MTATPQLTTDLQKLVLEVEDDLRERLEADVVRKQSWQDEYKHAVEARRTAMSWSEWRDDRIVQAAVSWVLTTVFVRFAEDNDLISKTWFTGPGERRYHAVEAQQAFFREHPELTDREWIEDSFQYLRTMPATAGLVDEHAALQLVSPSGQMAGRILEFWRQIDDDGSLLHDLADPTLSTRFLGDLYQDLSSHARKAFALLQTPKFVEEFILDQTLTPALKERPLEGFKLIDPTCGSGHFLLGAFHRITKLWKEYAPNMDTRERVQAALDSIYGVDINAFAVAVARFRLAIAALQICGELSLESGKGFEVHVETGDSLLHGRAPEMFDGFTEGDGGDLFTYKTEDQLALRKILLPGQYDVVVGNPPYITVKDRTLNARYRELYPTCKGQYALSVPFMERFFELARQPSLEGEAGWVGKITSNSFMKRQFGTKLVQDFLANQDVQTVIDTSGAYIPGHGTPTVILVGRNRRPQKDKVKAVFGIQGEPERPEEPSRGLVWSSIEANINSSGYEDDWITVAEVDRDIFSTHPWNLQGGAAPEILGVLEDHSLRVSDFTSVIGRTGHTGADEAYFGSLGTWSRFGVPMEYIKPLVTGDSIRQWSINHSIETIFPYDPSGKADISARRVYELLWRNRTRLANRRELGGTHEEIGLTWYEWSRWHPERFAVDMGIAFASVATHNEFAMDRGGKVFKQSAPVIQLAAGASEDQYLSLLGILNSSAACFWLKQNNHNKGSTTDTFGARQTQSPWENFYDFTSTTLKQLPLPSQMEGKFAMEIDIAAQRRAEIDEKLNLAKGAHSESALSDLCAEDHSLRTTMIALQEELDWQTYQAYGLTRADVIIDSPSLPAVELGQRAFEIVLARKMARGEVETAWFDRHRSTPITEIPAHWPKDYRELVQRRIDIIESDRMIALLEQPEYKRRWLESSWEERKERAFREWLLDRIEHLPSWYDPQGRPRIVSVAQLADVVNRDEHFVSMLERWAGQRDVDVARALRRLVEDEAVPFLAAYRLKESGLRKYEEWKSVWELQRLEDEGEKVRSIAVPPNYTSADFRRHSYWLHRGRLDVPKERFILYPGAELSTDDSMVLGWSGWDYSEQFLALAAHMDRMTRDGAADRQLIPILAGLKDLVPWVKHWHSGIDPTFTISLADFSEQELEQRRARLGVSYDALDAWRPPEHTRRRKRRHDER